jgi:glycogen(starch) synthase
MLAVSMQILVLTNLYPPHHLGGYELSCSDVMDRLRARGHDVTVLTTTTRFEGVDEPADERAQGIRRDLAFYWDEHKLVRPPVWRRFVLERANQDALRSALDDTRPDVVSVWNMGAMSLGLLTTIIERDIPMVLAVCDDWLVYGPLLDRWARLFRRRKRLGRIVRARTGVPTTLPNIGDAGAFCFVTDFVRRRAAEKAHVIPRVSTVVYSGIDRIDFPPATQNARPWSNRLLYVGRIDDRKGIDVAVTALSMLPDETTLEIVGRGDEDYRRSLEAVAARLGVAGRISFDVVPRAGLKDRYRAADALLFPVVWEEPFGLVPIEAMACGTPVVATGTGGSAEFLANERNCLLVRPGDADDLARAVTRLSRDAGLRARLVANGLLLADELTTDRLADVFEAWHVAAADRFAHGYPENRPSPLARLRHSDNG